MSAWTLLLPLSVGVVLVLSIWKSRLAGAEPKSLWRWCIASNAFDLVLPFSIVLGFFVALDAAGALAGRESATLDFVIYVENSVQPIAKFVHAVQPSVWDEILAPLAILALALTRLKLWLPVSDLLWALRRYERALRYVQVGVATALFFSLLGALVGTPTLRLQRRESELRKDYHDAHRDLKNVITTRKAIERLLGSLPPGYWKMLGIQEELRADIRNVKYATKIDVPRKVVDIAEEWNPADPKAVEEIERLTSPPRGQPPIAESRHLWTAAAEVPGDISESRIDELRQASTEIREVSASVDENRGIPPAVGEFVHAVVNAGLSSPTLSVISSFSRHNPLLDPLVNAVVGVFSEKATSASEHAAESIESDVFHGKGAWGVIWRFVQGLHRGTAEEPAADVKARWKHQAKEIRSAAKAWAELVDENARAVCDDGDRIEERMATRLRNIACDKLKPNGEAEKLGPVAEPPLAKPPARPPGPGDLARRDAACGALFSIRHADSWQTQMCQDGSELCTLPWMPCFGPPKESHFIDRTEMNLVGSNLVLGNGRVCELSCKDREAVEAAFDRYDALPSPLERLVGLKEFEAHVDASRLPWQLLLWADNAPLGTPWPRFDRGIRPCQRGTRDPSCAERRPPEGTETALRRKLEPAWEAMKEVGEDLKPAWEVIKELPEEIPEHPW